MIRSMPLYHMQTGDVDAMLLGLDISELITLDMPAVPILWEHHGMFGLVPMEHVQDILDAERRQDPQKKTGWPLTRIPWAAATPLEFEVGKLLSRRVTQ